MPTYAIYDSVADPAWCKTVNPYTWTAIPELAKEYLTQAAANSDCAALNANTSLGTGNRFSVGSHPHPH